MSYSTLYLVPELGEIEEFEEFRNGHGSAPVVWDYLFEKYITLGPGEYRHEQYEKTWELVKDDRLSKNEKISLVFTFDHFMCKKKDFDTLSMALREMGLIYLVKKPTYVNHLVAIADALDKMKNDPRTVATCINHTSVGDAWEVSELNEDREMDRRLYDISKDTEHWFLDEEYPHLL